AYSGAVPVNHAVDDAARDIAVEPQIAGRAAFLGHAGRRGGGGAAIKNLLLLSLDLEITEIAPVARPARVPGVVKRAGPRKLPSANQAVHKTARLAQELLPFAERQVIVPVPAHAMFGNRSVAVVKERAVQIVIISRHSAGQVDRRVVDRRHIISEGV